MKYDTFVCTYPTLWCCRSHVRFHRKLAQLSNDTRSSLARRAGEHEKKVLSEYECECVLWQINANQRQRMKNNGTRKRKQIPRNSLGQKRRKWSKFTWSYLSACDGYQTRFSRTSRGRRADKANSTQLKDIQDLDLYCILYVKLVHDRVQTGEFSSFFAIKGTIFLNKKIHETDNGRKQTL